MQKYKESDIFANNTNLMLTEDGELIDPVREISYGHWIKLPIPDKVVIIKIEKKGADTNGQA